MRVLLLTQWFQPEPFFKGLPLAQALQARGNEVQVLTGYPNYPAGRLYDGYRMSILTREVLDGVEVIRVPLYPSHDRSALKRASNYISFALSAATVGVTAVRSPDVIYAYHPPGTIAVPALAVSAFRHAPVVYDVQDLWPDSVAMTGMLRSRGVLLALEAFSSLTYRAVDHLLVLAPGMKRVLVERGVPEAKVSVVYNWTEEVAPEWASAKVGSREPGPFTVLFAGGIGLAQGLDVVVEAARLLVDRPVRFVLMGEGVEKNRLQRLVADAGLGSVEFWSGRPRGEAEPALRQADALLVHLQDDGLFDFTIPSKIQAYLHAGRPILAGVRGDAAELVERSGAGLVFQPGSGRSLADAVRRMAAMGDRELQTMGESGRRYYDTELCMAAGVERIERVLKAVVSQRSATRSRVLGAIP